MRLWHHKLIPHLDRNRLLSQHRECCALRGKGWGRPHATVNYVFEHPYLWLVYYHMQVIHEMLKRGYNVKNYLWQNRHYRSLSVQMDYSKFTTTGPLPRDYPEHDDDYLAECLENLRGKGIEIEVS